MTSGFRNLLAPVRARELPHVGNGRRAAGLRGAEVARASRRELSSGAPASQLQLCVAGTSEAALVACRVFLALPAELSAEPLPSSHGG